VLVIITMKLLEEDVVLYRLPGERLGLGLRFEGGDGVSENVRALFIKYLVSGAPAARAKPSWGRLQPGDEILSIQSEDVRGLTRLNCVNQLGDASVSIVLKVGTFLNNFFYPITKYI
jgi:C-terminal processing protease CtpA/Prc